ncbi:hypothetical protein EYB25_006725 [Talaromyces marneffei]|nr:hypothetical protein EYB25_006725 [Talaromyces marneffei]
MAHQAPDIHWEELTSCLKIHSPKAPTKENPTNLYFRFDDNQDKNISHFVTSLVNNIKEHTASERRKYPEKFDIPDEDDLILDDAVTQKIAPLVYKWRKAYEKDLEQIPGAKKSSLRKLCTHDDGFKCGCAIPFQERKADAFLRQYALNGCWEFYECNSKAFYNIEVVKTLILYGEMDPILRVCAHPYVDFKSWESQYQCYCMDYDAGWDIIYKSALSAYLSLNILYCFPSLWDPASSTSRPTDYRSTKLYQRMLRQCTWCCCTSEAAMYPHREFFGIGDEQFGFWPRIKPDFALKYMAYVDKRTGYEDKHVPYGAAPIQDFLDSEKHDTGYLPDVSAVALVRILLYRKGLPVELVDDVMEKADYTPKRKLVYSDDPFHQGNLEELQKYLKYCWQLIINCNLMADALGVKIGWEDQIYRFFLWYISSSEGRKIKRPDNDGWRMTQSRMFRLQYNTNTYVERCLLITSSLLSLGIVIAVCVNFVS